MTAKIFHCLHAKGGAGASLFATNFSYALSKKFKNKKVLFLDANQMSDISHLFGINPKKDILNLIMFLEDSSTKKDTSQEITDLFNKTVYQVNTLDVLLSPTKYHGQTELTTIYKQLLKKAITIYDYIVIDSEKNDTSLLKYTAKNLHSLLMITTIDNPAITKTTSLLNEIDSKAISSKIQMVCNQTNLFTQNNLDTLFTNPVICSLPTEINGAWDNILLGAPIVENTKLAYSRKITELVTDTL